MKFYPDSLYGFCEVCRKTDVPVLFELANGTIALACPSCSAREFDDVVMLDQTPGDRCAFGGCHRPPRTICSQCMDDVCAFHDNTDGLCDTCSPLSRGWSTVNRYY